MMSTQELIDWVKVCHPNVSIHAYDSTWRKFMKHIASASRDKRYKPRVLHQRPPSISYSR